MTQQLDKKSILEMSSGAILERVDYEMGKVLDNILDSNTKADAKRKITVTVEFVPSADRRTIVVKTTAKSTLCPTDSILTSLYVTGESGTGEVTVAELTPDNPGQVYIDGSVQEEPKILKIKTAE